MSKKQKSKREIFKGKNIAKTNLSTIVFDQNQFENTVSTSTSIVEKMKTSIVNNQKESSEQTQTATQNLGQNVFESIKTPTKIAEKKQKKIKKTLKYIKRIPKLSKIKLHDNIKTKIDQFKKYLTQQKMEISK